jgi:hypothetical protein
VPDVVFLNQIVYSWLTASGKSKDLKADEELMKKATKYYLIDNLKRGLVVRFEIAKGNRFISNDMFYDADDNAIFLYTLIEPNTGKKTEREVRLTQEQAIEKYEMVKADSNYSINEFYEN